MIQRTRLVVLFLLAILAHGPVLSQTASTGVVAGTVTDAGGRALSKVTVTLRGAGNKITWTTVTDDAGRFRLLNLPPGGFTLTTMRSGYVTTELGAVETDQPGVPVTLAAGQRIEDLAIRLRKGGIISGTIHDENGDPISAQVIAMPYRTLGDDRPAPQAGTASDARGRYRIANLAPGDYLVAVVASYDPTLDLKGSAGGGRMLQLGHVSSFYPGVTTSSTATPVSVSEDRESGGIDMTYSLVPITSLTVWVSAVDRPLRTATIEIRNADERFSVTRISKTSGPSLLLDHLGAGRYRLEASGSGEDGVALWAAADVVTDGINPVEIPLVLGPGASIKGHARWTGADLRPSSMNVQVIPVGSQGGSPAKTSVAPPAGSVGPVEFSLAGVRPGRYVLTAVEPANALPGWTLSAATMGGQDVLDLPFDLSADSKLTGVELTLSDRVSELSGSLTDGDGRARTDVTLIALAVDPRYWWKGSRRVQTTRPDTAGRYTIRGLPAGEYILAAVLALGASGPYDPTLLAELAKTGVRESLAEGERKTRDLKFVK
jgi:hypothetical protein